MIYGMSTRNIVRKIIQPNNYSNEKTVLHNGVEQIEINQNGGDSNLYYSDLKNAPIKTLIGTNKNYYISLAGIHEAGEYAIRGYFKWDSSSELSYTENYIRLSIFENEDNTSDKASYTIVYFSVENDESFIYKIRYENSAITHAEKLHLGLSESQVQLLDSLEGMDVLSKLKRLDEMSNNLIWHTLSETENEE